MKNELKFNSQVCTSVEQSNRLLELGLKPETADMSYYILDYEPVLTIGIAQVYREIIEGGKIIGEQDAEIIPAWSLHRLIELSDIGIIDSSTDNIYDKAIQYIKFLIKCGDFNKEYLKQ